ncbi:hypothetical protein ACFYPZ_30280 [Streptomyces sp. NPDC005506]|uniref:hypothetical protein n=1 Tax=unclassified Streptomyces TaxID=2593676 RepID=UPI0036A954F5
MNPIEFLIYLHGLVHVRYRRRPVTPCSTQKPTPCVVFFTRLTTATEVTTPNAAHSDDGFAYPLARALEGLFQTPRPEAIPAILVDGHTMRCATITESTSPSVTP